MGLQRNERAIFLSISNGKVCRRHKEPGKDFEGKDFVKVTTKEGKSHYEEQYDQISGIVTGVKLKENPFGGNNVVITIKDEDVYQIEVGEDSSYARDLVGKLINADLSKPVTIKPFFFKRIVNNKEKKTAGVTLYDSQGNKIESAFMRSIALPDGSFKKEYYNGYPEFPENADKEELKIYSLRCVKHAKQAMQTQLIPKLEKSNGAGLITEPSDDAPIEDDDLPF
jgi:hypothetical protein